VAVGSPCPLQSDLVIALSHAGTFVISAFLRSAFIFATSFESLIPLVILTEFTSAPIGAIIDAFVLHQLGEDKAAYGMFLYNQLHAH